MIKLIIFDFDGVLADSFDCLFPLIKKSMGRVGLTVAQKQYRDFFLGNIHRNFMNFIKDKKKYAAFSEFRKNNFGRYYKPTLFDGATETLNQLNKNFVLAIASSGKKTHILTLLEKYKVRNLFSLVLATTEFSKEEMLWEILQKSKISPGQTVMITDTVGDLRIAKKIGLKTVAVTWGFQSVKVLKSAKPDFLAKNFSSLNKYLNTT